MKREDREGDKEEGIEVSVARSGNEERISSSHRFIFKLVTMVAEERGQIFGAHGGMISTWRETGGQT